MMCTSVNVESVSPFVRNDTPMIETVSDRLKDIREKRLGLSMEKFAKELGYSHASGVQRYESAEFKKSSLPSHLVEKLARFIGQGKPPITQEEIFSLAGLSAKATTPPSEVSAPQPEALGRKDLPVYASAEGGSMGEMIISYDPIEWRERPSILDGVSDGFAMYVVNDSMEPRYFQGDLLLVHPRRPPRPGNDVLLIKKSENGEHHAMIKRLVRSNSKEVVVRQFNPPKEIVVPRDQLANLFRVLGAYWAD